MFGVADYTFDNGLLEAIMIFQEMSSSPGSIYIVMILIGWFIPCKYPEVV